MSFYVALHKASNIKRHKDGRPYTWLQGRLLKTFSDPLDFTAYVDSNIGDLTNVIAFTGSASLITTANAYIASALRARGLL